MKSSLPGRSLDVAGSSGESTSFRLDPDSQAHLMMILRDALYSDKPLAVVREYVTNAWDAHVEAGKPDQPIEVHLPTHDEPWLEVRDRGLGLSRFSIETHFVGYGASTKRKDDAQCGTFGVGSKSAFCYVDAFAVTSRHGGVASTYSCALGPDNLGTLTLLDERGCGDETGLSVRVPVRAVDFAAFREAASKLLRYIRPAAVVNAEIEQEPDALARLGSGRWVAVMGCVPYLVDLDKLGLGGDASAASLLDGTLCLPLGSCAVAASRETLRYDDETKATLRREVGAAAEVYLTDVKARIDDEAATPWQRRIVAVANTQLRRFVDFGRLACDAVGVEWPQGLRGTVGSGNAKLKALYPQPGFILYFHDAKSLRGLLIKKKALIRPAAGCDAEAAMTQLLAVLDSVGCGGCPVVRTSTLPAAAMPLRPRSSLSGKRVSGELFELAGYPEPPYSAAWRRTDVQPTAEDAVVRLRNFIPHGGRDELSTLYLAKRHAAEAGIAAGRVIGVRPRSKAEVKETVDAWLSRLEAEALHVPGAVDALASAASLRLFGFYQQPKIPHLDRLTQLPPHDPIRILAERLSHEPPAVATAAAKLLEKLGKTGDASTSVRLLRDCVVDAHPMVRTARNLHEVFTGEHAALWADYFGRNSR